MFYAPFKMERSMKHQEECLNPYNGRASCEKGQLLSFFFILDRGGDCNLNIFFC